MTTIDYAAPAASTRPALLDGARTLFNAPALFIKRRFVVANTYNQLSGLSDAQLKDIGVVRGDIRAISNDMAARTF